MVDGCSGCLVSGGASPLTTHHSPPTIDHRPWTIDHHPVNYFAHGLHHLDRPLFLAGTAVPDWMSVADRAVRVRPKLIEPLLTDDSPDCAETASGILRHFEDDDWFHSTRAFALTTAELTHRFVRLLPDDAGMRPGFLGHIVTEMLLDAVLIGDHREQLDTYYAVLESVDPEDVQSVVNRCARGSTSRLAPLIPLFLRERFLYDYLEAPRLLHRLNQVLRRVKLQPLPAAAVEVLVAGREIVADRRDELLPPERFGPR
jgi:hypothetical protein